MLEQLVEDSKRGVSAMRSETLRNLALNEAEAGRLADYVESHPDHSAYHSLIALRRSDPARYQQLPNAKKAEVLCGALANLANLNDWGYLAPKDSHDGEVAQALLEIGAAAEPCLRKLLSDRRPAPLFGSEPATMSSMYKYRRCDFAFRYLSRILGLDPRFDPDPARRDADIAALEQRARKQ